MSDDESTPAILIDTREQDQWPFEGLPQRRATLATGDYSLAGFESRVCVERKSHSDAYGVVGAGRARFVRCLERMAQYERAAVVIECTFAEFMEPPKDKWGRPRGLITPRQAIASYLSWAVHYNVHVYWPGSRELSERVALRFLTDFVRHFGQPGRAG